MLGSLGQFALALGQFVELDLVEPGVGQVAVIFQQGFQLRPGFGQSRVGPAKGRDSAFVQNLTGVAEGVARFSEFLLVDSPHFVRERRQSGKLDILRQIGQRLR